MAADMDDGLVAGLDRSGIENASKKMKRPAVRLRPFGYSFGKAKKPRCLNKRHNVIILLKVYIITIYILFINSPIAL